MATIHRPCKKDPETKAVLWRSRKWYIKYRDADGRIRNIPGFKDRNSTLAEAARIQRRVERERAGLADPAENEVRRPLAEHLDEFGRSLAAKDDTSKHVGMTLQRAGAVISGCGFKRVTDISSSRVQDWLKDQRESKGLSVASSNGYLRAVKGFTRWLVKERRLHDNPLAYLSCLNAKVDRRHVRRVLSHEEFAKLYEAALRGEPYRGISGPDRARLLLTAVNTGFRVGELASLTPRSFSFDGDPPTVTVEASYSKHRRDDTVEMRPDVAAALRSWIAGRSPLSPLWPGTWSERAAVMLRIDLAAAGIPYRDEAGQVLDFYALRHSGITWFCKKGSPKAIQTFARHHSAAFTLDNYAHISRVDMEEGLAAMPPVPGPENVQAIATGTCPGGASRVVSNAHPGFVPPFVPPSAVSGDSRESHGLSAEQERKTGTPDAGKECVQDAALRSGEGDGARTRNLRIDNPML